MASRWDVGDARQGHYNVVMHWMSEDSHRQLTHGINRTIWRNLGLFPSSIFGLVLNRTTLD